LVQMCVLFMFFIIIIVCSPDWSRCVLVCVFPLGLLRHSAWCIVLAFENASHLQYNADALRASPFASRDAGLRHPALCGLLEYCFTLAALRNVAFAVFPAIK
jgi:hypothetical protein